MRDPSDSGGWRLDWVACRVLPPPSSPIPRWAHLPGEYVKHNNNFGFVEEDENDRNTPRPGASLRHGGGEHI